MGDHKTNGGEPEAGRFGCRWCPRPESRAGDEYEAADHRPPVRSFAAGVLAGTHGLCLRLGGMTDEGFAAVERRIRAHQREQFFTRSGLPMTNIVEGDRIKVDRAQPWLSMEGAKEIWGAGPGCHPD